MASRRGGKNEHIGGRFNSQLEKTGFLSEFKKNSRLIAKNPTKFLEDLADNKIGPPQSKCSQLESFIADLQTRPHFRSKEAEIRKKQEFMNRRTFILKMASSNVVSVADDDIEYLRQKQGSGPNGDEDDAGESTGFDADILEEMIQSYIQQIRVKILDMPSIFEWIVSESKMTDMRLPYGLPKNLKIPSDPEALSATTDVDQHLFDFIESSVDNFLLLDGEYHTKIEQITQQIHLSTQQLLPEQNTNEWTLMESAILSYVTTSLEESSSTIRSHLIQSELLSKLFPNKAQESIINQKYLLKSKKMLEEKRNSVINDWNHDKIELQNKINIAWQQLNRKRIESLEQKITSKKQKELCGHWSKLVDEFRAEKCAKIKQLEMMVEPLRKKRELELSAQRELEVGRRAGIRNNVAKYKQEKDLVKFQSFMEKEHENLLMGELKKVRETINKGRIDFRKSQRSAKEQARKEAEQAKEAEILARAARLESIKEPVEIEREPWNAISDTHCSAVRRFQTLQDIADSKSSEQQMVRFFREYYSFTTEKILTDRRVRLEMKLRDAGLMESSYARQVLMSMQPKEKPHLRTQIKFDHES